MIANRLQSIVSRISDAITPKWRKVALEVLLVVLFVVMAPKMIQQLAISQAYSAYKSPPTDSLVAMESTKKLSEAITKLDKKLAAKIPSSYYVVINTASNEFSLYKKSELVRKDKCSTGSYTLLKNGDQQQWLFKTPKGEFKIQGKNTSPVWKKPDWAFVEAGLPIPPINSSSRFEYGVLGDYALSLGHGYLIHGTLYQRFLGLPVTHGCVRLNDENLELVYKSLNIGSKVYIF